MKWQAKKRTLQKQNEQITWLRNNENSLRQSLRKNKNQRTVSLEAIQSYTLVFGSSFVEQMLKICHKSFSQQYSLYYMVACLRYYLRSLHYQKVKNGTGHGRTQFLVIAERKRNHIHVSVFTFFVFDTLVTSRFDPNDFTILWKLDVLRLLLKYNVSLSGLQNKRIASKFLNL